MLDSLYEIVVLADGDVVLQRSDDAENPLVKISFSEQAQAFIEGKRIEVAKAMIDAAIDTVQGGPLEAEDIEELLEDSKPVVLH